MKKTKFTKQERSLVPEAAKEKLRIDLKGFSDQELAWNFHCNVHPNTKKIIFQEGAFRGIDLCQIEQHGPDLGGWRAKRAACGKTNHENEQG